MPCSSCARSSATSRRSLRRSPPAAMRRRRPMRSIWHVARKEMAAFFSSLAALIFIGVFLAVCLFVFFWVETFFALNIAAVRPLFEWMPLLLLFLGSALTMGVARKVYV